MKQKNVDAITGAVLIITLLQGLIPIAPALSPQTVVITSATFLFLSQALTAWKQFASCDISNDSLYPTIAVFVLAILGGANDLFNVIPLSELAEQWVRFTITALTLIVNALSKFWFPIEGATSDISIEQFNSNKFKR